MVTEDDENVSVSKLQPVLTPVVVYVPLLDKMFINGIKYSNFGLPINRIWEKIKKKLKPSQLIDKIKVPQNYEVIKWTSYLC